MSRTFAPGPAYRLFLERLVEARIARGHSLEELSEIIGLTPAQIAAFESGAHPLTFTDVRNWLLALDVPFVTFVRELDDVLDSTLETDEGITFPRDAEESKSEEASVPAFEPDPFARAAPLPHQVEAIQVLFFAPGAAPEVRTIENTLEAKQALVGGLITTFETGVEGTVGVANDEALLCDMPPNRAIPATGTGIFGPFLIAGDAPGGFRSLAPLELEGVLDALCPELSHEQMQAIVRTLDGGPEWMEMWN